MSTMAPLLATLMPCGDHVIARLFVLMPRRDRRTVYVL